eukprot:260720-Chlamydomonas_euryale.AAC.2
MPAAVAADAAPTTAEKTTIVAAAVVVLEARMPAAPPAAVAASAAASKLLAVGVFTAIFDTVVVLISEAHAAAAAPRATAAPLRCSGDTRGCLAAAAAKIIAADVITVYTRRRCPGLLHMRRISQASLEPRRAATRFDFVAGTAAADAHAIDVHCIEPHGSLRRLPPLLLLRWAVSMNDCECGSSLSHQALRPAELSTRRWRWRQLWRRRRLREACCNAAAVTVVAVVAVDHADATLQVCHTVKTIVVRHLRKGGVRAG